MSATRVHSISSAGRARPQRGAALVSLEHMMALAAEMHRAPSSAPPQLAHAGPRPPVRISAEEWALLFPAWPVAA